MMGGPNLLMLALSSIGVRLPALIALVIGLVMLADASPGRVRRMAVLGLGLLLVSRLLGVAVSLLPAVLVQQGGDLRQLAPLMGLLGMLGALLDAIGVIVVVWALVKALRGRATVVER